MAAKKKKPAPRRARVEPTKRCARCPQYGRNPERPLREFPRNAAMADGLAAYCRQCKREADRERLRGPQPPQRQRAQDPDEHPRGGDLGDDQNYEPRARAPALAITDEMIDEAARLIATTAATRRAAARFVGVSENTFKSWLREGGDLKDDNDPRRRLLFAIEMAEGHAERQLTKAYWDGAQADPQVAQRFLERRFSKGDEKWARTEHLSVENADSPAMEIADARKLLNDKLGKLLAGIGRPGGAGGSSVGTGAGAEPAPASAPPAEAAHAERAAAADSDPS
jgi:hypothetical protein